MRESDLLRHIYGRSADLTREYPQVAVGPGDDCAVVKTSSGDSLLVTVDQLVEGRHFARGEKVDHVARKAIARSISDIAAMGGSPTWALATGALPHGYDQADELFDAMARWARHWGAPLVGGDIASAAAGSPLVLTCTVAGTPHPVRGPVLRSGAKPGDNIWVTGRLGGSLESGRHLTFEPRIPEGRWLCDTLGPRLHAMIDISDGLGIDAGRIAEASGIRIELDMARLPLHPGLTDPLRALSDGEDYELCFAAAAEAALPATIPPTSTPLTCIGKVIAGTGCAARDARGTMIDVSRLGWDHQ